MKYAYNVTLKQQGSDTNLQYEFGSHDDLFKILDRVEGKSSLDDNTCAALIVGIKSLGSALMANKDTKPMSDLMPHFKEMMKALKNGLA